MKKPKPTIENKSNVVGAGFHPCPKQKHINKHTSNVVGVDCIDPQNHCNNKMDACNAPLHCLKQNSAITLIALIITIIVLLILAGVTISMVMGDSRNI